MIKKELEIQLFFSDLESTISNSNIYTILVNKYVYTDSRDESAITVSSKEIMRDLGSDVFEIVRSVCLKHGMPDPTNDLNQ